MLQEYLPYMLPVIGALVALTNLTVEVVKKIIPDEKLPTNIVAVVIAMIFTLTAFFSFAAFKDITPEWYYVVGSIVGGILVAYGAMFGYDKLKEIVDKFKS